MEGVATLWIKDVEGEVVPQPVGVYESAVEHEQQVIILHVQTGEATINIVFRRGEFSHLVANPNDPDAEKEVAVNIDMEDADDGNESSSD